MEGITTEPSKSNNQYASPIAPPMPTSKPSLWTKTIPRINLIFMIVSLVLVFGLDLSIIVSSPDLRPFWYMMLAVFGAFMIFFVLENFVFRKKFIDSSSSEDKWISATIIGRNVIFVLNFIPFIQLLGLIAVIFGGWLILLLYIVAIYRRFRFQNRPSSP